MYCGFVSEDVKRKVNDEAKFALMFDWISIAAVISVM